VNTGHDLLAAEPAAPMRRLAERGAFVPAHARSFRAGLTHPRLMLHHRLVLAVVLVNVALLFHHSRRGDWQIADGSALTGISALVLVNITGAVLIRQRVLLNLLYGLAGRARRSWPLPVRWTISKVHQVGGLHVGFAFAGTAWLVASTAVAFVSRARHPRVTDMMLVLCIGLALLLVTIVACATSPVRTRAHNVFEQSHRWGGWTAIVLSSGP
jgi:hypothetical protein